MSEISALHYGMSLACSLDQRNDVDYLSDGTKLCQLIWYTVGEETFQGLIHSDKDKVPKLSFDPRQPPQ